MLFSLDISKHFFSSFYVFSKSFYDDAALAFNVKNDRASEKTAAICRLLILFQVFLVSWNNSSREMNFKRVEVIEGNEQVGISGSANICLQNSKLLQESNVDRGSNSIKFFSSVTEKRESVPEDKSS